MGLSEIEKIKLLLKDVKASDIQQHLQEIFGERHRKTTLNHLEHVRTYIRKEFNENLHNCAAHKISNNKIDGENIWGYVSGEQPSGTWLLTAHYDSVEGSPGADDNASAVAGLLSAMSALSAHRFRDNIAFVAFDLEEESLAGSMAFVSQLDEWPLHPVKGVINLEMIGYISGEENSQAFPPGMDQLFPQQVKAVEEKGRRGDFITNVANEASQSLMTQFEETVQEVVPELKVVSLAVPGNGEMAPVLRRSDHAGFWDAGVPALMLTDTSEFRNPNYHLATDTLGTLNVDFITSVAKAATVTLARLAKLHI